MSQQLQPTDQFHSNKHLLDTIKEKAGKTDRKKTDRIKNLAIGLNYPKYFWGYTKAKPGDERTEFKETVKLGLSGTPKVLRVI